MSASLIDLIGSSNRIEELHGSTPDRIVSELLAFLTSSVGLTEDAVELIQRAILSREREATTGIGKGIAIPHMKECAHVEKICGTFGRSKVGIEWAAIDGEPVHLFFLVLTPPGGNSDHIQLMKRIVALSQDRVTLRYLIESDNFDKLTAIFQEIDESA